MQSAGNRSGFAAAAALESTPSLQKNAEESKKFADQLLTALPEPFLSVRAVAGILSVSTATVYRLVEQGELPHRRVSGAIRIRPEDLRAYVASR